MPTSSGTLYRGGSAKLLSKGASETALDLIPGASSSREGRLFAGMTSGSLERRSPPLRKGPQTTVISVITVMMARKTLI